ncbi:hypothetical protein F5Y16DRAFT_382687 [Xylariaceae sp. FL0255]|nr:hypothetical protein F5Y16DRAFT_382687 [Xylariaceae sp. FL0255]
MEIPGYYYDPDKRKYFKIEASKTAPPSASWSSDKVKRRKLADENAAEERRRTELSRGHIRPACVLNDALTGGFFARECGAMSDDMQAACFARGLRDEGSVSLAMPSSRPEWEGTSSGFGPQVRRMYVDGQDQRTGMCAVLATSDERSLVSGYIPRDENGRINQRLVANYRMRGIPPYHEFILNQLSDIQYHAPTNNVLLTSRAPGHGLNDNNILWAFSPTTSTEPGNDRMPYWRLPSNFLESIPIKGNREANAGCQGNIVTPAPAASSPLICAVGTDRGVVTWERGEDRMSWLTPIPTSATRRRNANGAEPEVDLAFRDIFAVDFQPGDSSVLRLGGRPGILTTADTRTPSLAWSFVRLPSAIAHLRCLGGNQVLVAGLRSHLSVYDMRFIGSSHRTDLKATSTAACDVYTTNRTPHKHSIQTPLLQDRRSELEGPHRERERGGRSDHKGHQNQNQNPNQNRSQNQHHSQPQSGHRAHVPKVQPVIIFEKYCNEARTDLGFAFDASTGLIAAANDEGYIISNSNCNTNTNYNNYVPLESAAQATVSLYSIRTGAEVRVLDGFAGPVVRSLQFQDFPRDHTPSLFVGAERPSPSSSSSSSFVRRSGHYNDNEGDGGCVITAFSFGVAELGEEA